MKIVEIRLTVQVPDAHLEAVKMSMDHWCQSIESAYNGRRLQSAYEAKKYCDQCAIAMSFQDPADLCMTCTQL